MTEPQVFELEAKESPPVRRLTVVEQVYHQQGDMPPVAFEGRWSGPLESDESTYQRPGAKVAGDWIPLDLGWLGDQAGSVIIENITGRYLKTIPTEEEKAELASKTIQVAIKGQKPFTFVPPGQHLRINLFAENEYFVCCPAGPAEFNIFAIPR